MTFLSFSSAQAAFPDVPNDHPNKTAIEFLQDRGIISGAADGNFYPGRFVNRAEFLKMALLSSPAANDKQASLNFSDVNDGDWFYEFVARALNSGIIRGYTDGSFKPAQNVNKVEALKMLLVSHQVQTQRPSSRPYLDVEVDAWFSEFVSYVKDKNLIGVLGDNFSPGEDMTRADLAEIIYRLLTVREQGLEAFPSTNIPTMIPETTSSSTSSREISITDGVKHSIPIEDIRAGGPPKDGIPSIDNPKFTSVSEGNEFLEDEGIGVAVSLNGIDRFYPHQITVWHEIVNDNVGGTPALITYCPLCGTGIVFDPVINGEDVEFGTSGKLWNSNLVMYDRKTDTYWSQVLGEAIVGELTGMRLTRLPYDNIRWKDWKKAHPDGEVLSRDTGYFRNYLSGPYGDYATNTDIYFPVDNTDDRYHSKEPTFGITLDGLHKAYTIEELDKSLGKFVDNFAGLVLEIDYDKVTQTIDIRRADTKEEVVPDYGFWFSWISVHPDTEVYVAP